MVDLGSPAQRLGEGRRADRGDHELLDVHVVVGVRAAVQDVHHRDRQHVRVRPAEVAEQRQAGRVRGRPGHRHADPDDGVRAEPGLVRRPVQVDQRLVDQPLVVGLVAEQLRLDLVDDALDRPGHRLAAVLRAAVPQLDRLERAGRGPARHPRPAHGPVVQRHLDLEGRVTAGIQDLPGMDRFYGGHRRLLACRSSHTSGWAERKLAQCEPNRAKAIRTPATPLSRRLKVCIGVILDGLEDPAMVGSQRGAVPVGHRRRPRERLARRGP